MSICFNEKAELKDLGGGVKRRLLSYNDNLMVVEILFEKGAVGALHSHPHQQIGYVALGEFDYTCEGKTTHLKAGDSYLVEANLQHGVVCTSAGKLVDVFTPKRDDFL
jgi:quercetin dioxygenase-like cupin family protein